MGNKRAEYDSLRIKANYFNLRELIWRSMTKQFDTIKHKLKFEAKGVDMKMRLMTINTLSPSYKIEIQSGLPLTQSFRSAFMNDSLFLQDMFKYDATSVSAVAASVAGISVGVAAGVAGTAAGVAASVAGVDDAAVGVVSVADNASVSVVAVVDGPIVGESGIATGAPGPAKTLDKYHQYPLRIRDTDSNVTYERGIFLGKASSFVLLSF